MRNYIPAAGQGTVSLGVVGKKYLTEEGQDDFGLSAANFGEVEALLCRDDLSQELFLFLGWDDLAMSLIRVRLVVLEISAQDIDELGQWSVLVLVEVEELLGKYPVVVPIIS